jgi:hypothetical protein
MSFLPDESKATFSPAEFPFFEGVMHHPLRAVIMLILGCDVYKSGMKGVVPKKLADMMEKIRLSGVTNNEGHYLWLFEKFKKASNLTDDVIDTYMTTCCMSLPIPWSLQMISMDIWNACTCLALLPTYQNTRTSFPLMTTSVTIPFSLVPPFPNAKVWVVGLISF